MAGEQLDLRPDEPSASTYAEAGLDGNPHRVRGHNGMIDNARAKLKRSMRVRRQRAEQQKLVLTSKEGRRGR